MTGQALRVMLQSADDVTPDVLTSLLRRHDPDVAVTGVTVGHTWQGTTSHLHFDVTYADPNTRLPQRLFVKTQLSTVHELPEAFDESLSEGGGGTVLYDDETRFYRDLRPDLDVETMTTYFAEHLDGPSQFLIIGEDITLRGAQVPDAVAGLSVEQVDALLATLSRVHAPFWGSPRLADGGDLSWLQHPVTGGFADFLRDNGFAIIRALIEAPYKKALLDAAGTDMDGMEAAFWRLQERVARDPITLLHGDPHPRNTYALPNGQMGVLDWQLVRRGSWSHDVGYALIGALSPELRRAHERELLDNYRGRLLDAGVTSVPDREAMWAAFRQSPAWGFCMWAIAPDQMYSVEVVNAVLSRFAEAYLDLGTGKLLS
ncbi:ecdysteroid 22-kinase family protein [Mycobacterium sp. SMC-2]|uniref:ecdysteroid 22-kinase family protein n=1 Tax=Mycobacterium TaxID=1763 RepID=UPI001CE1A957|nr:MULTISPECIES: ecdysteroid 22-kinase family protein [Mycobacterium]MCA4761204.1 phosphotransferase [Mycobacterium avium subsp. hominissuis]UXA06327.1 ecdysteroid 22-kinase family protein [Mycobacterium sp. SMC-2]